MDREAADDPFAGARRTRPMDRREDARERQIDLASLNLPRGRDAIIQYLANSYRGVGGRTAEMMVEAFGADIFRVFHEEPERVREVVPRRADQVLEAWHADLSRRAATAADSGDDGDPGGRRTRDGNGNSRN